MLLGYISVYICSCQYKSVSGALFLINYIGMFWQSFLVIEIIVFGGVAEELVQFVDMSAQTLNAAFSLQSALTQRFLLGEHASAQLNLDTMERQNLNQCLKVCYLIK